MLAGTLRLTGPGVVNCVITALGLFDVTNAGRKLIKLASGVSLEEVRNKIVMSVRQ